MSFLLRNRLILLVFIIVSISGLSVGVDWFGKVGNILGYPTHLFGLVPLLRFLPPHLLDLHLLPFHLQFRFVPPRRIDHIRTIVVLSRGLMHLRPSISLITQRLIAFFRLFLLLSTRLLIHRALCPLSSLHSGALLPFTYFVLFHVFLCCVPSRTR